MCHALLRDASFHRHLVELDRATATEARERGCPVCGGPLHVADYPRKPRGGAEIEHVDAERRFSFCCGRQGCRRRLTPPSVRFLGRRVHSALVVTLGTALSHGLSGRRLASLRRELGLRRRTLERWRRWWRESVPATSWWKEARGRFAGVIDVAGLPATLLERLEGGENERIERLLVLLGPLSVTAAMAARSAMAGGLPQRMRVATLDEAT